MGDGVFNVARGKIRTYCELAAANDALVVVLLLATGLEADDALVDHDTLAALLAASNDEATFTNYARKTIISATITVTDVTNRCDIVIANQTWTAAGGATNNTLGKAVVCYDPDTTTGTDTDLVPLTHHDYTEITTGANLPLDWPAAGFWGSQ